MNIIDDLKRNGFRASKIGNTIYIHVSDSRPFDSEVDRIMKVIERHNPSETVEIVKPS